MLASIAALSANQSIEVWPENWPTYLFFTRLQTQWNSGVNGKTGLNYIVVLALMDRMKLTESEHDALFDDIRQMEIFALNEMHSGS